MQKRPPTPGDRTRLFRLIGLMTRNPPGLVTQLDHHVLQVRGTVSIFGDHFEPIESQKPLVDHLPMKDRGGRIRDGNMGRH